MPRLRTKSSPSRRARTPSRMKAPPHPFPELQGPFEESMSELERFEETDVPSDAASRRTLLLDAPTYQRVIAGRWKQRPGEKYHPLWKVIAQLSFGLHLLAENLAKSEEDVMQILQGHIDEIDLFLERTTEDFALAQDDIRERMRCLQLPLQHPKVFDRMLEDRAFRNSIVEGNEKIEHIVARTGFAMKDSLKDAQKGLDATNALAQYLDSLESSWTRRSAEHEAIFEAMLENVEGWRGAFVDLREQGDRLGDLLKELTDVINQMQQRAGEVSRRLIRAQQKQGASPADSNSITYIPRQSMSSTGGTRSGTPDQPPRKPLPGVPDRASAQQLLPPNQRCGTAQSTRSVASQRSSNLQVSRVASREGHHNSIRDSAQTRSSTKSPRLIEVRRHSPHGFEVSQPASSLPSDTLRPNSNGVKPVELSSQTFGNASQINAQSNTAAFNPGLGIVQDRAQNEASSKQFSPASPTVTNIVAGPPDSSNLPLTPNSMISNGDQGHSLARELSADPASRPVVDPFSTSRPTIETALSSPPSTPGWAKQTFDIPDKERAITERTAFRSHPPNADFGSPPVLFQARFNAQTHHARVNGSIASSLGAPGPEVASSPVKSVRSIHMHGGGARDPLSGSASLSMDTAHFQTNGKKEFVAELEGITPITVRVPTNAVEEVRKVAREVTQEVIELEVPLQPPSSAAKQQLSALEQKFAAAVRKSFIATNIELPGVSVEEVPVTHTISPACEATGQTAQDSTLSQHEGMEDIMAQLEQLSAPTTDLTLKGEETLMLLPATTYVAASGPASRSRSPVTSAAPKLTASARLDAQTARSKPALSRRTSTESTASSHSQWRAFFKGQLSPTDFNSSTPHLPSKVSTTHKAIIELQRRGQEASPTLGWQWAPETPDIERGSLKRLDS